MRSGQRDLMSQAGQQTREGAYDVNRQNMSKNLALAGLTKGTNETMSSEGKGTVTQSESPWKTAAGIAASAAPLSL